MKFQRVLASTLLSSAMLIAGTISVRADGAYQVPRLPDGAPDFQGTWRNATATPVERDPKLGNRRAYTEQEARAISEAALARVAADAEPTDPNAPPPKAEPLPPVGNYNLFWTDRGMTVAEVGGEYRTSIIIDPANGRIPSLTAAARQQRRDGFRSSFDGPEARSLGERCILSFGSSAGPPMLPTMYNSHYQIVQSPGHVVIMVEMVHDARIIRIDDKPMPEQIKKWMGDSIGYYDGDSLVVVTKNFRPEQSFRGSSENMVVTERFTRVADDKLIYRFTVEDPETFESSFTGELPFVAIDEPIYEYACHEGNYAMEGILAGARQEEQKAAKNN